MAKFPDSHPNITHQLVRPENGGGHPLSAVQAVAGTVIWTSPSWQTYTTHPGSRLLFPTLCRPTAPVSAPADAPSAAPNRGVMMPRRTTTREHDRAKRIEAERARNREIRENPETSCDDAYFPSRPPPREADDPYFASRPPPPGDDDDPPPF